jgi:uncharacterized protein YkwD
LLFLRRHYHFIRRSIGLTTVLLCLAAAGVAGPAASPAAASAGPDPGSLEAQLYNLIQQDRWQRGETGLVLNPTLAGLARGSSHQSCGGGQVFHGRAQDMVERNYFTHQIPPCGALIFPAIAAAGQPFAAAAENIAWSQGGSSSPGIVNSGFMASAEHRTNILGSYNSVGVGAWPAPDGWAPGGGRSGVVVFSVIFARVSGVVGPAGPPPPPPAPVAAAPPPAPPPPSGPETAPPPPEPSPASQVLGDHDGVTLAAPLADTLPPVVTGAAVGPAFLRRLGFMMLALLLPGAILAVAVWRRVSRRAALPTEG